MTDSPNSQTHVYRLDKFAVPAASRSELLQLVGETHAVLRAQPGFVRELVLEQQSVDGDFRIVTLVEWESQDVMAPVFKVIQEAHRRMGFDREATFARLGIRPDLGMYQPVVM